MEFSPAGIFCPAYSGLENNRFGKKVSYGYVNPQKKEGVQ